MKNQIDNECLNYYLTKIELKNLIAEKFDKINMRYKLEDENCDLLLDLKIYLRKLLSYLSDDPKAIALLLMNSNPGDVKSVLAPFFCHNFYQNIISPYTVEGSLLYIIAILLNQELEKLESQDDLDNFLNEDQCTYFLRELRDKDDIRTFSKNVIKIILEQIEIKYSERKINIDIEHMSQDITKMKNELKKINQKIKNIEHIIFLKKLNDPMEGNEKPDIVNLYKIRSEKESNRFNDHYVSTLTKSIIENMIKNTYKDNEAMIQYLQYHIEKIENDNENLFSNEKLIDDIFKYEYPGILFALYQIDFLKIVDLLDLFISTLEKSLTALPYTLKFICKIIYLKLENLFPDISEYEIAKYISKFLFVNILIPNFMEPIRLLIHEFIISENTINNLNNLLVIFSKFVRCELFDTNDNTYQYTPFNWYFIKNLPKIFLLYSKIIKCEIPDFIEQLINGTLDKNYKYNYFNENPDEVLYHKSCLFNMDDIDCLMTNLKLSEKIIFQDEIHNNDDNIINTNTNLNINEQQEESKLYIIFQKLYNKMNRKSFRTASEASIITLKEKLSKPKIPITIYVLFTELLTNPKHEELFNLKVTDNYYKIKELKKIENDKDFEINNIIRAKNYLCGLLYNYRKLKKFDFTEKNNTEEILNEIKNFQKEKEFGSNDNKLPYDWYVNSFLDCLKKIPIQKQKNDYEILYDELETELKKSIKKIDFFMMSDCYEQINYIKKGILFHQMEINAIKDICLNQIIKNIVENNKIPIRLEFKYTEKEQSFQLYKYTLDKNSIEDLMSGDISQRRRVCINISKFINFFPNFVKMGEEQSKIDILYEIKKLCVPKVIKNYLNHISLNLNLKKLYPKEGAKVIKERLFEYILTKLYEKIYPKNPSHEDLMININCIKYSWIEPKHFFQNEFDKNYDLFIDDIKECLIELEKVKTPNKKLDILLQMFNIIEKISVFNGKKDVNTDEELEIISYLFIKAQPKRINSDLEYINIFIKEDGGEFNFKIKILLAACQVILTFSEDRLQKISREEVIKKCQETLEKLQMNIGNNKNNGKKKDIINKKDEKKNNNIIITNEEDIITNEDNIINDN